MPNSRRVSKLEHGSWGKPGCITSTPPPSRGGRAHLDGRAGDALLLREAPRRPPAHVHRRRVTRLLQPPRHIGHVPEEQLRLPAAAACQSGTCEAGDGSLAARHPGVDRGLLLGQSGPRDGRGAQHGAAGRVRRVTGGGEGDEAVATRLDEAHAVVLELVFNDFVQATHPGDHFVGGTSREGSILYDGQEDNESLIAAELLFYVPLFGSWDTIADRATLWTVRIWT